MFEKGEVKRNLIGCLDVVLFMPDAKQKFGNTRDEAIRSFCIPIFLYPLSLIILYLSPMPEVSTDSKHLLSFLYSMRVVTFWALFFGIVYWIAKEIGRLDAFYKFVTASNWLTLPSSMIFIPVIYLLATESYSWQELYPFMMCLVFYSYAFTLHMASCVLRAPWEIGGFIVMISIFVNDSTTELLHWAVDKI